MSEENSLAYQDQSGAIMLSPEMRAHIINLQTYGDAYKQKLMMSSMSSTERMVYRVGNILGRFVGSFAYLPNPNSVTIVERRSLNPANFGETTLETRGGFGADPKPGQLTFRIPFIERIKEIQGVQDQYPVTAVLSGTNGIEIPGLGSLGLRVKTIASINPQAERYDRNNTTAKSSLMTTYTAYDGDLNRMLSSMLPTIIYGIWDDLSKDEFYQERLNRALQAPGIKNNPLTEGRADPEDLTNNNSNIDHLVAGFQQTMNIFNLTAGGIKNRLYSQARRRGIDINPETTLLDIIPSPETQRFLDNLGQITEEKVNALSMQMKASALVNAYAPLIQGVLGEVANTYLAAQRIKASAN